MVIGHKQSIDPCLVDPDHRSVYTTPYSFIFSTVDRLYILYHVGHDGAGISMLCIAS